MNTKYWWWTKCRCSKLTQLRDTPHVSVRNSQFAKKNKHYAPQIMNKTTRTEILFVR